MRQNRPTGSTKNMTKICLKLNLDHRRYEKVTSKNWYFLANFSTFFGDPQKIENFEKSAWI